MTQSDFDAFAAMLRAIHDYYGKELSDQTLAIWWSGCKRFELAEIRDALNRHVANPDSGQFLPKIADLVKMSEGTTGASAQRAWSMVDYALRSVGPWRSVTFDDRITMRVLADMGGWAKLANAKEQEWPFVAKEFQERYRSFRARSELPDCPAHLPGIAERHNASQGLPIEPVMLIGDKDKALAIKQSAGAIGYAQPSRPALISISK